MASNVCNRQQDFTITESEVNLLKEALKDEEFRKLLIEYSKEISDPKNVDRRETEIVELQRQQGYNIVFIEPSSNYVLKTWTTCGRKVMINICTSSKVAEAYCENESKNGQNWSIPYITGSRRIEVDRKNQTCDVIDIIFHDHTLELANTSQAFRKILHSTALDATETAQNCVLNKENLKFPKLKYKGSITKCILKTTRKIVPNYEFVYREDTLGRKIAIIVKIKLPLLSVSADCNLEITDTTLQLVHDIYNLTLQLPVKVNSSVGTANFDKASKLLTIDLPTYENSQTQTNIPLINNVLNTTLSCTTASNESEMDNSTVSNESEMDNLTEQCKVLSMNHNNDLNTTNNTESLHYMTDSNNTRENTCMTAEEDTSDSDGVAFFNEKTASTEDGSTDSANSNNEALEQILESNSPVQNNEQSGNDKFSANNNIWQGSNAKSTINSISKRKQHRQFSSKIRSFSESSDDFTFSHSPCKSILKSCSLSSGISQSLEHSGESAEAMHISCSSSVTSTSVKKSVSFSDVISKQLYRADSSILGQRKKNQRRARNKRKNMNKRQNSESEDVFSESESSVQCNPVKGNGTVEGNAPKETKVLPATEFSTELMFDIDM